MIELIFSKINNFLASIIFFDVMPGEHSVPLVVAWLIIGASFLTIRMGFINLFLFRHGFNILLGRYHTSSDKGSISSFQALTTALSATVGLGNIAGVAIAISIGGPGAVFWMIVAGFLNMTSKFTEVTLAQMYREFHNKKVLGGPMEYLEKGFSEFNLAIIGKALAIFFSIGIILASLGGGNVFQVSQALGAVQNEVIFFKEYPYIFGIIMAFAVGFVIIGGIKKIAQITQAIVPFMLFIYLSVAIWIIASNFTEIPDALSLIFTEAFNWTAATGGAIGAIVQGFKRAAFSSEAGLGSTAIVHSSAAVKYPIRQGIVALYEPFIDTVIVCTITALVIILTGVYNSPEHADLIKNSQGAALTAKAFGSAVSWFPNILSISIVLFAYSTMIAWFYYGDRCWSYLFKDKYSLIYKVMFLFFIILATITSSSTLLNFTDLTFLMLAFPNFIGLYLLHNKVRIALKDYLIKLKTNTFDKE